MELHAAKHEITKYLSPEEFFTEKTDILTSRQRANR